MIGPELESDRRPLRKMTAAEVADLLRGSGMHSPNKESRDGPDALTIREDVSMWAALSTAEDISNAARALFLLIQTEELTGATRDAVNYAHDFLTSVAAGMLATVRAGMGQEARLAAGAEHVREVRT